MSDKLIWEGNDWDFEKLKLADEAISRHAFDTYKLDIYPNQIEIITAEQMLTAYSSIGLPIHYEHWSHGKQLIRETEGYKRGEMGLAYEIVINSSPTINYLMEENTMTMQALVIAHAAYGHNSFFKNNYLFRQWTDADSIVDYMIFARNYIRQCEERYGEDKVEEIIDSCHALMNHGVDRYKKPRRLSLSEEKARQSKRHEINEKNYNDLWRTLPPSIKKTKKKKKRWPAEPTENLLYFIEKNSPILENWQREIVRIVRKISQYFYPQKQTQVMNEGWATFTHYNILNDMAKSGEISHGTWLEFIKSHSNVIYQPTWDQKHFRGFNVYTLGFNIFRDMRRICENPTEEDRQWFPDIAGSDWLETLTFAMKNFKDESFIKQYLSPKVIRDLKMFSLSDNSDNTQNYVVSNIHNEDGYREVRKKLSNQYNLSYRDVDIQVYEVDKDGSRAIYLRHYMYNGIPLGRDTEEVLKHVHRLWGFDVILDSVDSQGKSQKTYKIEGTKND